MFLIEPGTFVVGLFVIWEGTNQKSENPDLVSGSVCRR